MNDGLIIFLLCVLTLIGATLPLCHGRRERPPAAKPPAPATPDEGTHAVSPGGHPGQDH
jgi:hypothetical protein